jgi:RNA-directed DNA polymerase
MGATPRRKLLIKPSKANVAAFLGKVRATVKGNKALDQEKLIQKLNPMIQGWANYHQHVVSKEAFARVDHEIWRALWQWAVRRHPQKGNGWIKRRYFHTVGTRHWVFAAATGERFPDGKPILTSLRKATDTPIRRHRPIKLEANPFDPQWERYFEERVGLKMRNSLRGKRKLIRLWLDQDRCCPICHELITQKSRWHVHHIVWRVNDGKDGCANLIMVHPNCHNQVHVKGIKVVKPAPARGL